MRASGRAGTLRYHYQVAARFGAWTLTPVVGTSGHRFRLSADLEKRIEPWASHQPLDLYLFFGSSQWIWYGINCEPVGSVTDLELHDIPTIMQRSH